MNGIVNAKWFCHLSSLCAESTHEVWLQILPGFFFFLLFSFTIIQFGIIHYRELRHWFKSLFVPGALFFFMTPHWEWMGKNHCVVNLRSVYPHSYIRVFVFRSFQKLLHLYHPVHQQRPLKLTSVILLMPWLTQNERCMKRIENLVRLRASNLLGLLVVTTLILSALLGNLQYKAISSSQLQTRIVLLRGPYRILSWIRVLRSLHFQKDKSHHHFTKLLVQILRMINDC